MWTRTQDDESKNFKEAGSSFTYVLPDQWRRYRHHEILSFCFYLLLES